MRYQDIDVLNFKNAFGENRSVHQMYLSNEVPSVGTRMKPPEMDLDAMMVALYGEGEEASSHRLRDVNVASLLDYNFDESKLLRVKLAQ